jgi:mediator of RNA polymerase II transcription subunit 17
MSGAEALGEVTLRPWPAPKKEGFSKQELLRQIEQLTTERGHLRDITEKSLQEDIDAGKTVPDEAAATAEAKKDDKDAPSKEERLQAVYRAQQEISGHLEYALFLIT